MLDFAEQNPFCSTDSASASFPIRSDGFIHLRPHHLLCLQKYTGHGYSRTFTDYMDQLTLFLKTIPDTPIMLQCGCDDICAVCPNKTKLKCSWEQKVMQLDRQTSRVCRFSPGQTASWVSFAETAYHKILRSSVFHEICGTCSWYDLCLNPHSSMDPSEQQEEDMTNEEKN